MHLLAITIFLYSVLDFLKNKKFHTSIMMKWLALYHIIYFNIILTFGILFNGFYNLLLKGWTWPILIACLTLTGIPSSVYNYLLFKEIKEKNKWIQPLILCICMVILIIYMV